MKYEKPNMMVILLEDEDVIRTSVLGPGQEGSSGDLEYGNDDDFNG